MLLEHCQQVCELCVYSNYIIYNVMSSYVHQVLSESVSKALEMTGGPDAAETARFAGMMDKFFDCLNVTSFNAGKRKRKPFQDPYRSSACRYSYLLDVVSSVITEAFGVAFLVVRRRFPDVPGQVGGVSEAQRWALKD